MLSVVGCMDFCMGMRLHMLMYAAINSIPMIGLVYDPKVSSFMKNINQNRELNVEALTEDVLYKMLAETVRDYETIKGELKKNYSGLKEKALKNAQLAVELYEKGSVDI